MPDENEQPTTSRTLSRRRFTQSAVAITVVSAAAGQTIYLNGKTVATEQPLPLHEALFADTHSAAELGSAYLRNHPDDTDAVKIFGEQLVARHEQSQHNVDTLKSHIDTCVREDFAENRMTRLDGWVLSITECRLFAWFYLTQQQG